jgi:hypothetical protein
MAYPNGSGQGDEAKDLLVQRILKRYFIGARATQIRASRINQYIGKTILQTTVIIG